MEPSDGNRESRLSKPRVLQAASKLGNHLPLLPVGKVSLLRKLV